MTSAAESRPSRPLARGPLRIAHRGGNTLRRLAEAERWGVDVVELDLWLHRGRLDVRHSGSLGILPVLREGWALRPGRPGRLQLADALHAAAPGTRVMLDLKGHDSELPAAAIEVMAEHRPGEPYIVSARHWELLAPFRALPHVLAVYSCGSADALADALALARSEGLPAVGANRGNLDPARVADLREHVPECFAWAVGSGRQARELVEWGVTGIISDDFHVLHGLSAGARQEPRAVG
ncbi:MAG: glycerophosphodiester phosphodiesterase [Chloroflexi bacterium]|nr:glycerophosphodiester phosphodiesterase [Chloroflexota bacterium]